MTPNHMAHLLPDGRSLTPPPPYLSLDTPWYRRKCVPKTLIIQLSGYVSGY